MKSGQAQACSCRQQFHSTICASHIGWQGEEGSIGSTARREESGGKYTTSNPKWAAVASYTLQNLLDVVSAPATHVFMTTCPSYLLSLSWNETLFKCPHVRR